MAYSVGFFKLTNSSFGGGTLAIKPRNFEKSEAKRDGFMEETALRLLMMKWWKVV